MEKKRSECGGLKESDVEERRGGERRNEKDVEVSLI